MNRSPFLMTTLGAALAASAADAAPPTPTPAPPAAASPKIQGPEARVMVEKGALLLDVRTPEEFAQRHLPNAVNIPVDALPTALDRLPKDRPIVVYCASGRRSARATSYLLSQGRTAKDLGPIDAW